MKIFKLIGATIVAASFATGALAADLPRQATKAPVAPMIPAFNWTGFYIGLNGGYGWADSTFGDANGFVGGGQIGYNWQAIGSPWVFGLEADIQGSGMDASATSGVVTVNGSIDAFATLRGRIGYAFDRFMIYGTGGAAFTKTELSATNGIVSVSDSDWSTGYTLGAGFEWAVWQRMSVKLEYLYVDSGDINLTLAGLPVNDDYDFSVIRAGLNWRF